MTEWTSGDVFANGIRIHYYRTGGNKPAVVLSHGVTDSGLCWSRVARQLEGDYDVVMYDTRGHGLSEVPDSHYTTADRAADLAGLIEALGLKRPAVGGHSLGADTSFHFAARYPGVARSIILEDPPFRISAGRPEPAVSAAHVAQWQESIRTRRAMTREALLELGRTTNPKWSEEELEPWSYAKLQVSPKIGEVFSTLIMGNWLEMAPKVTCPTLLITADPELGAIVTPEAAREMERLVPTARTVRLTGAGHNIRREAFADYIKAVKAFLAES